MGDTNYLSLDAEIVIAEENLHLTLTEETLDFTLEEATFDVTISEEETLDFTLSEDTLAFTLGEETVDVTIAEEEVVNFEIDEVIIQQERVIADRITKTVKAQDPVSALRVVVEEPAGIRYAQPAIEDVYRILGVTQTSGLAGDDVIVATFMELYDASWNWDLQKPIYLGANGTLTQTAPTTGMLVIVGFPNTVTGIIIDTQEPVNMS